MSEDKYERLKKENIRTRKKSWSDKTIEVSQSYQRAMKSPLFFDKFYSNLFFLKPEIEKYFINTKWEHQKIALEKGIQHLLGFLGKDPGKIHHKNILRLSESHSKKNLNIHPHNYYYWIDAMIMTLEEFDPKWHKSLEYYHRECVFFPISFMISRYYFE